MAKLLSVAALAMMATAVVAQPTLIPDPTANQLPASTDPSLLTTPDAALATTTDPTAPLPGPGPNPDAATTMVGASGGAGAWSFDYGMLRPFLHTCLSLRTAFVIMRIERQRSAPEWLPNRLHRSCVGHQVITEMHTSRFFLH